MKLTRKGEYALLAMVDLARCYQAETRTIAQIAEQNKIPKKYLEQILLLLKSAGFVKSSRGMQGGYALAKSPKIISLANIIRLIDGAIAPVSSVSKFYYEATPITSNEKLLHVFQDIRDYMAQVLENTYISDLL